MELAGLSSDNIREDFSKFVREVESELSRALIAAYGPEVGREAARDALVYAWEHWERVSEMDNPVGYLYRVGQSKSRRHRRTRILFPEVDSDALPHVEPDLPEALEQLSNKQRAAVALIHVEGMSEREAAEAMGISRATVRRHARRGLSKLRSFLEVNDDY